MLIFAIGCGVLLAIWAPFGTQTLSAAGRLLFWVGLCSSGSVGAAIIDGLVAFFKVSVTTFQRVFYQSVGATSLVSSILIFTFPHSGAPFILMTIVLAWTVSIVLSAIGIMVRQRYDSDPVTTQAGSTTVSPVATPKITRRLPIHLKEARILALTSEDHYVRVICDEGSHLLLMRLSDAIDEVSGLQGLQTHRSWWVAKTAIAKIQRTGRTAQLTLKDSDLDIPVSRSGLARLKDNGWL
ncbi:MAG: LytTR family DNA-binding domain-containing protein [Pseudomonadota bacterium]